jgi:hypothetical protein
MIDLFLKTSGQRSGEDLEGVDQEQRKPTGRHNDVQRSTFVKNIKEQDHDDSTIHQRQVVKEEDHVEMVCRFIAA